MFTPLVSNLSDSPDGALPKMQAVLVSELLVTPFMRFMDIGGNVARHVIAPRALTQSEMNRNFLVCIELDVSVPLPSFSFTTLTDLVPAFERELPTG